MSLIYQSYLSFQTPMYTWRSAPTTTAAALVLPSSSSTPPTSSTTPMETTTVEEEDPVIHDLCLQFHRSMLITTIWNNNTHLDQEVDELCHSFRFMHVHDDKDDEDQQERDDDQQQYHDHDNHVATSATAGTTTTTTITTIRATSATLLAIQNDPIMEALCAQMQSLSIHHVFKPIQKKRSSPACADYGDDDDNNDCPIPTKRQRVY